ncbi:MAG TPA: AMP-binding protein, partial [Pseudomonadales bacterium]|nr:AMP-binding protein [Pseudomonadales bacterium]
MTAPEPALHPAFVAARTPDRPALVFVAADGTRSTWTYGELEARANRAAALLRASGFAAGDVLAVLVGNRPEVFVLFWAAMRIGARFTPISIHLKPAEIAWILSSSRARALV